MKTVHAESMKSGMVNTAAPDPMWASLRVSSVAMLVVRLSTSASTNAEMAIEPEYTIPSAS